MEHPLDVALRLRNRTVADLAAHLGVTRAAVAQWKQEGRVTPAEHCPKIERYLDRAVLCEQLNDKVDWEYVRTAGAQAVEMAR